MLIGLLQPGDGRILLDGASILEDLAGYQSRIGYLPEESNLYSYLSGREYLELAGKLRGLKRSILDSRIERLLDLLQLWEDRDALVASYSKKGCARRFCWRPR
jgi:ABC-2 type transport system ATP-binding protein